MGRMLVSSCGCCMFQSCVYPVQALRAAFCVTCSFLMLVGDAMYCLLELGCDDRDGMSWWLMNSSVNRSVGLTSVECCVCELLVEAIRNMSSHI